MPLNDCTILINSCDSYEDVWLPFFFAFKENWRNCPCDIVLNTETKKFSLTDFKIITINSKPNSSKTWGKRLLDTLKSITTKYVIMLFDDYILEAYVNQAKIETCLAAMETDPSIAVFYFSNIIGVNILDKKYPGFELLPQKKEYKLNSAPALWRKDCLLPFVGKHDNPWAWEYFGSARTYSTRNRFYCAKTNEENVFVYNYKLGGAIHRGKWVRSVILPVLEKYKLHIDLNVRGFENEDLKIYKHSFFWNIKFLLTGFKMIQFKVLIFIFRIFFSKLSILVKGKR